MSRKHHPGQPSVPAVAPQAATPPAMPSGDGEGAVGRPVASAGASVDQPLAVVDLTTTGAVEIRVLADRVVVFGQGFFARTKSGPVRITVEELGP